MKPVGGEFTNPRFTGDTDEMAIDGFHEHREVRDNGGGDTVDDLLDGATADGEIQDRRAELLDGRTATK